jgi:hypothetical protein
MPSRSGSWCYEDNGMMRIAAVVADAADLHDGDFGR